MRKMYFALNALITPHLKELDTGISLTFYPDMDYVQPNFNEDVLSLEIDESQIVQYDGAEGYATLSEMRRNGKEPTGLWAQNEGASVRYNGPISFLQVAETVVRAPSHNLESVPHIRVIITSESELRTDPWWWSTDAVKVLVKQFAPEWATIGYAGVKVNDKAFEAIYVPTVVKLKEARKAVGELMRTATTALENVGEAFHTFDKKDIDLDFFF
jgi:hypothetical protein